MSEISSKAVEEAAMALWESVYDRPWASAGQLSKDMWRRRANLALRRAHPFIVNDAELVDQIQSMQKDLDVYRSEATHIDEILSAACSSNEISGLSKPDAIFHVIALLTPPPPPSGTEER